MVTQTQMVPESIGSADSFLSTFRSDYLTVSMLAYGQSSFMGRGILVTIACFTRCNENDPHHQANALAAECDRYGPSVDLNRLRSATLFTLPEVYHTDTQQILH